MANDQHQNQSEVFYFWLFFAFGHQYFVHLAIVALESRMQFFMIARILLKALLKKRV